MSLKCLIIFSFVALAASLPAGGGGGHDDHSGEHYGSHHGSHEDHSYEFTYHVGDESKELDFGHHESKNSDGLVEGYYYVLLPDSRLQRVKYYVDGHSGFVADVTYEGSAEFHDHYGHSGEHSEEHHGSHHSKGHSEEHSSEHRRYGKRY